MRRRRCRRSQGEDPDVGCDLGQCLGQQVEALLDVHSPEEEQDELAGELRAFGLERSARGGRSSKGARSTPLGMKQTGVQGASLRRWPISGRERA